MLRPTRTGSPLAAPTQSSFTPITLSNARRPASPSPSLLAAVAHQPEDVMHTIAAHMSDAELGQVALRTQQAMLGATDAQQPHTWLSIIGSNCRIRAHKAGPHVTPAAYTVPTAANEDLSWAMAWSRHVRLAQALNQAHAEMTRDDDVGASVPVGNTALILALDALRPLSPEDKNAGAQKALALCAFMEPELARTPIAWFVRAMAQGRLGHVELAEALLAEHVMPVLDVFLEPSRGNGGHTFYGAARIHGSRPADVLVLLKDVAIETQSVGLFNLFLAAASFARLPVEATQRETIYDLGSLYDHGHVQMLRHILNAQPERYKKSTINLKMFLLDVPPMLPPNMERTPELERRWAECVRVVQDFLASVHNV